MLFMLNMESFIIHYPDKNGITIFVAGFLFAIAVYHFLLYFQHKDKSYLYYSLYTFLVFVYIYYKAGLFFLADMTVDFHRYLDFFSSAHQWVFNTLYLVFTKTFIDLKYHKPKWNKILNWAIYTFFIILIFFVIHSIITRQNETIKLVYAFFYIPSIALLAIITLILVYSVNNVIKYYLLIGSISYLVLATMSYYISMSTYGSTTFFYSAILIENIFFALGLGAKQRKILTDKNTAQKTIIKEQEINLKLKKQAKSKLDSEVARITQEIVNLTEEHKEEQRKKLESEYSQKTLDLQMKALQTQMNPHFLFNSLNSLKHYIIQNKKEDAAYFLSKLSQLIRKILDNTQQQQVSLRQELDIMRLYMEVENMRLDEAIHFSTRIDIGIDSNRIKLPPLVLQPFVENSIRHGLALYKGKKQIKIKIQKLDHHLEICIEDNGIGRERAAINRSKILINKESLGIALTKQRLLAFSENMKYKASIRFEDMYKKDKPIGTKVFIVLPLE